MEAPIHTPGLRILYKAQVPQTHQQAQSFLSTIGTDTQTNQTRPITKQTRTMIIIRKSLNKIFTLFNDTGKKTKFCTFRFVLDLTSKPVLQCKNRLKNKFDCKTVGGVNSRIDPNLSKLDRGTVGFPNLE